MTYKRDSKVFEIAVIESGPSVGWFRVENDQPYNFGYAETFEEMKKIIKKKYDEYHSVVPTTKGGWLELFESCVIRDSYEDWHIDEELAMRLLELYKNN